MAKKKKHKKIDADHYTPIYWPESMMVQKARVYDLLLDIDANYSRLMQSIVDNVEEICKLIISEEKNYRHYEWNILLIDRETREGFSSLPSGTYDLTEVTERTEENLNEEA